jgi:predicted N-acyltransferase
MSLGTTRFINSVLEITAEQWDALFCHYPFLRHGFLAALEESGCTVPAKGWKPQHLLLENEAGDLLACLPLFLKDHSYGEYVFDWAWAEAYQRHGFSYYPKLLTAAPYTPCAGPRVGLSAEVSLREAFSILAPIVENMAVEKNIESWHLLFPNKTDLFDFNREELVLREGCQYQWFNNNYTDFDDFLASLNSRKRKNLRKERQKVKKAGITFSWLHGQEVSPEQWQTFYQYYANTYHVRGRPPYLNLDFFLRLARSEGKYMRLLFALKQGKPCAGALFFLDKNTLYGRYWGCDSEMDMLHFETCYYQGIELCIREGLQRFDSGAQGEHKIQRGFEPVTTYSLHWIAHQQFRDAIKDFVTSEADHVRAYKEQAATYLPFKAN